jgi:putative membrane protein
MMIARRSLLLGGAVGWAMLGWVQAQTPSAPSHSSPGVVEVTGTETSQDPQQAATERVDAAVRDLQEPAITDPTVFVKGAVLGNLTEIELAKMARSKSQDSGVQNFANRILKDNESAREELTAIAKRKRLGVPTSLVYEDEETLKQGAAKSGAEFVTWYVRQMVAENERSLALFEGASKLKDPDLSGLAKRTLPTLSEHQRMAASFSSDAVVQGVESRGRTSTR